MNVDQIFVRSDETERERTQFVTLCDEFRVGLRTQYIHQMKYWALWVLDVGGTERHGPVALIRGVSLLRPYQWSEYVPKGQLWVSGAPMTLDNADSTSRLLYRPVS